MKGPRVAASYLFATLYYDLWSSKKRITNHGAHEVGSSVAIYTIYPIDGILPSHFHAIKMFREAGYSPIVVSNFPLSDKDRAAILEQISVLIERPNVGYDFGAFRDGVLFLKNRLNSLNALAFFNDSTWFPLNDGPNWLGQAEALKADFVGATYHFGIQRPILDEFSNVSWRYRRHKTNFHYASYAMRLANNAISDPSFLRFWKKMRLTNDKNKVVRRGETGLSVWLLKRGHSHDATHPMLDLDWLLREMSTPDLRATLKKLVLLPDPFVEELIVQIEEDDSCEPSQIQSAIMFVAARHGIAYALANFLIQHRNFQFLKKSPPSMTKRSRRIYRSIEKDLRRSGNSLVADEVLKKVEGNK